MSDVYDIWLYVLQDWRRAVNEMYDIWLYPLQDWWRTVNEMSDFMSTGQMENSFFALCIFLPLINT